MDMTMIDITDCGNVAIGEEVVLIGAQGQASITAADLAHSLGTIPYEVLCSIGPRVQRVYLSQSENSSYEK
jgi:alanine racemase